jgi:hypothetical protein
MRQHALFDPSHNSRLNIPYNDAPIERHLYDNILQEIGLLSGRCSNTSFKKSANSF